MRKIIIIVAAALSAGVFAMPEGFTDDWDAALKKAAAEKKNVLALFTGSDWCIWCKRLEGEILSKKEFSDNVGKTFVPVFLDFPSDKSLVPEATAKRNKKLAKKYEVRGYPSVLILDAKGEVLAETGYDKCGPVKYLEKLNSIAKNGPLLKKHIKPYEEKFMKLGRKFDSDMRAAIKEATDKGVDKEKAEKDALIQVDKLEAKEGDSVTIDSVLLVSDGDNVKVGTPYVNGAKVEVVVENSIRDKKVLVFKYKSKKDYHRLIGHRQEYTNVRVKNIVG